MLKLQLQYFGHLMQRADSFEKTLMLGKTEGRRRGRQRRRWLDGITNTMDPQGGLRQKPGTPRLWREGLHGARSQRRLWGEGLDGAWVSALPVGRGAGRGPGLSIACGERGLGPGSQRLLWGEGLCHLEEAWWKRGWRLCRR